MFLEKFSKHNRYTYSQLVGIGVHIGHTYSAISVYSASIIVGLRNGICLINIFKFSSMMRIGLFVVGGLIARRKPIWFVTQDKFLGRYTRFFAQKCGEFSSVFYWIRGMVSNYRVVSSTARKFMHKPSAIKTKKDFLFETNFNNWLFSRYRWPGLIFVVSILNNYFAINEALSASIPSLGIWDTDALPQGCTIPVPGNDDSFSCIVFYYDLMAEYILYRKFVFIYLWFLNIRRQRRLISFFDWLKSKYDRFHKNFKVRDSHLFYFFSRNVFISPYDSYVLPYKIMLSANEWASTALDEIEVFRDRFSINAVSIVDKFKASQFKKYFFFRYFFFKDLLRRRSRALFDISRRKRKRRLYKRSSRSSFLFNRRLMGLNVFGRMPFFVTKTDKKKRWTFLARGFFKIISTIKEMEHFPRGRRYGNRRFNKFQKGRRFFWMDRNNGFRNRNRFGYRYRRRSRMRKKSWKYDVFFFRRRSFRVRKMLNPFISMFFFSFFLHGNAIGGFNKFYSRNINLFIKSLVLKRKRALLRNKIILRRSRRLSKRFGSYIFEVWKPRWIRYYVDFWRYVRERRRAFFALEREQGNGLPPFFKKRQYKDKFNNLVNKNYSYGQKEDSWSWEEFRKKKEERSARAHWQGFSNTFWRPFSRNFSWVIRSNKVRVEETTLYDLFGWTYSKYIGKCYDKRCFDKFRVASTSEKYNFKRFSTDSRKYNSKELYRKGCFKEKDIAEWLSVVHKGRFFKHFKYYFNPEGVYVGRHSNKDKRRRDVFRNWGVLECFDPTAVDESASREVYFRFNDRGLRKSALLQRGHLKVASNNKYKDLVSKNLRSMVFDYLFDKFLKVKRYIKLEEWYVWFMYILSLYVSMIDRNFVFSSFLRILLKVPMFRFIRNLRLSVMRLLLCGFYKPSISSVNVERKGEMNFLNLNVVRSPDLKAGLVERLGLLKFFKGRFFFFLRLHRHFLKQISFVDRRISESLVGLLFVLKKQCEYYYVCYKSLAVRLSFVLSSMRNLNKGCSFFFVEVPVLEMSLLKRCSYVGFVKSFAFDCKFGRKLVLPLDFKGMYDFLFFETGRGLYYNNGMKYSFDSGKRYRWKYRGRILSTFQKKKFLKFLKKNWSEPGFDVAYYTSLYKSLTRRR